MGKNIINELNLLFENNKNLIDNLNNEKKMLDKVFLDNSYPEQFKKELLGIYRSLLDVIKKRYELNNLLNKTVDVPKDIGILYNKFQQNLIDNCIDDLQGISKNLNSNILCFTINQLNLQERKATGTLISDGIVGEGSLTIPKTIYNIGSYTKTENIKKCKQLFQNEGITMVNPSNIFYQSTILEILSSLPASKDFLLPWVNLSQNSFRQFIDKYDNLYILPNKFIFSNKSDYINYSVRLGL